MLCRHPLEIVTALLLVSPVLPCWAQSPSVETRDLREMLERVSYNATERGPLLAVAPGTFTPKRSLPPKEHPVPSLGSIAAAAGMRVLKVGTATLIAPEQMVVINSAPGKAQPLSDLKREECFKVLLLSLTKEQWRIVGGSTGIGRNDLTPDQRVLFDRMLPDPVRVRQYLRKAAPEDQEGVTPDWEEVGEAKEYERSGVRLRFERTTMYMFTDTVNESTEIGSRSGNNLRVGDTIHSLDSESFDRESDRAFGVLIRKSVPNRLKPSQLEYASPALNGYVRLNPAPRTVRDLLTAIGQRTGLEIYADRRIAGLPLFLRVAPNQVARAGDLLMALALGVTGAYRRMGDGVFLLTDDVEGIGTRFARLEQWAEEANAEKRRILEEAVKSAARLNPMEHIGFAPNYPGTLPPSAVQRIEAAWAHDRFPGGVGFRMDELPERLRADIDAERQSLMDSQRKEEEPMTLDRTRVGIKMELSTVFVLPDGTRLFDQMPSGDMEDLPVQLVYEGRHVPEPEEPPDTDVSAPPEPPEPIRPLSKLKRAAVLTSLPTRQDAKRLVAAAKQRGLTEVWLRVSLAENRTAEWALLEATIAAGKREGIAVHAVVSLLREGAGTADRNLFGQTGDQYADLFSPSDPFPAGFRIPRWTYFTLSEWSGYYRGWRAWTPEQTAEQAHRIAALAAMPGLAGIVFRDTAPPGYIPRFEGQFDSTPAALGYNPTLRLSFLRRARYDPIDIVISTYYLSVSADLPFFPERPSADFFAEQTDSEGKAVTASNESPLTVWEIFRMRSNQEYLASIFRAVKNRRPNLPLMMEGRAGVDTGPLPSYYREWYDAERLPESSDYEKGNGVGGRRTPPLSLSCQSAMSRGKKLSREEFARFAMWSAERAAEAKSGLVLDLNDLPISEALRYLEAIPRRP